MKSRAAPNEQELIAELVADLDAGFPGLVVAYQDRLFSFALRIVGSPGDAEEAVQDAFVRAYRALRGYSAERRQVLALKPWLYRITLNLCRNRLRGRRPATTSIDRAGEGEDLGTLEMPDDGSLRPEAWFERSEEQQMLATLLAALPESYRVPVVLRFVQELSYAEAAAVLKQPIGTVKANVHRGIQRLRAAVAERERIENSAQGGYDHGRERSILAR